MPPRTGPNGAVVKPCSSTKGQRTARAIASNVVDLTGESQKEVVSKPNTNDRQRVAARGQEFVMEDSFIVTSLHHRPWGNGDDNTTVGVFSTEREAEAAANNDFEVRCARRVDGWESDWYRRPGDGMLQLRGIIEEGEKDSETYVASIKRVQQKRPVAVEPSVPSAAKPKTKVVKPRHVYVVKEEQRINVGEDRPQGFYNDLGDLIMFEIHGIYADLDDASNYARGIHDDIVEKLDGKKCTVTDTLTKSGGSILVVVLEEMMTYSVGVEKRELE